MACLDSYTVRVTINGVDHYATPPLHIKDTPPLQALPNAVIPSLCSTERWLACSLEHAAAYVKLPPAEVSQSNESWYIPHHLLERDKHCLVFNCSFKYSGQSLNDFLLPGCTLSPTVIRVLLRFHQYPIAISGNIKAMFHQVCLLDHDKLVLHFLWRNMNHNQPPGVFEWQVLPFRTICSPCCATYAQ